MSPGGMHTLTFIKDLPPGLIGVPCGDNGRTSDFTPSIVAMQKPPGTLLTSKRGLGPAVPLNAIGKEFMAIPHLQWLFLTNDDNLCPPNTIPKLLSSRMSVITGLYFGRIQPFEPVLFDGITVGENGERLYVRKFMQPHDTGIIRIDACGDGCLLIQRHVLERIPYPWWEYGETLSDACDHDMVLCRKIRDEGIDIWCDTDVRVDHVTSMAVRPMRDSNGNWEAHLVQGIGRAIAMPAPTKAGSYIK